MENVNIAWYGKHRGEEPPLIGKQNQGAGGIFFSGCNLRCVFCQNYQISQCGMGQNPYSVEQLADIMLGLQKDGAVNIDLVTPTIWWRQIKQALILAKTKGLSLPILWNSNAYESKYIIEQMADFVDIYLPDFKYSDNLLGLRYSGIARYLDVAREAIIEMINQVGVDLNVNDGDIATKGIIIRHLVLPGAIENSLGVLREIASINPELTISLMNQYYPMHKANLFPELMRKVSRDEFNKVYRFALNIGLENGWVQEEGSAEAFIPDFTKNNPFSN